MADDHRKQVKHYHEPGHLHLFTFSCYQRRPLLNQEEYFCELARNIDNAGREAAFQLVAFVFMPEHAHLLCYPLEIDPRFGLYLARIKQPTTKKIKDLLQVSNPSLLNELTIRERPGKFCFRFWQEGAGHDRNLWSPQAIENSISYLHENPLRRKLCQDVRDWKWSSARYYLNEPPRQQYADLPFVFGLPPGTLN